MKNLAIILLLTGCATPQLNSLGCYWAVHPHTTTFPGHGSVTTYQKELICPEREV